MPAPGHSGLKVDGSLSHVLQTVSPAEPQGYLWKKSGQSNLTLKCPSKDKDRPKLRYWCCPIREQLKLINQM